MFKPPKKQLDHGLKIKKINGKNLYQIYSIKYPRIHVDKYLTWKHHISNIAKTLNKTSAMVSKIGLYIDIKILKSIYHAIF